jgi:hypothetical protein
MNPGPQEEENSPANRNPEKKVGKKQRKLPLDRNFH